MLAAIGAAILAGLGILAAPFKAALAWIVQLIIEKVVQAVKDWWQQRQVEKDQAIERKKLEDNLNKAIESGTKDDRDKAIDDIMHH